MERRTGGVQSPYSSTTLYYPSHRHKSEEGLAVAQITYNWGESKKTSWRRLHLTWGMKVEKEWVAGAGRAFRCDGPYSGTK